MAFKTSLPWSTLSPPVEAGAVLAAFSGKEGQGRCGHHPVLSHISTVHLAL